MLFSRLLSFLNLIFPTFLLVHYRHVLKFPLKSPLNSGTSESHFLSFFIECTSIPVSLQLLILVTFNFNLPRLLQSFLTIKDNLNFFIVLLFYDLVWFALFNGVLFFSLFTFFCCWKTLLNKNHIFHFLYHLYNLCLEVLTLDWSLQAFRYFEGFVAGICVEDSKGGLSFWTVENILLIFFWKWQILILRAFYEVNWVYVIFIVFEFKWRNFFNGHFS